MRIPPRDDKGSRPPHPSQKRWAGRHATRRPWFVFADRMDTVGRVTDPTARAALERADQLTAEVLRRWPNAWSDMDRIRTNPPQPWPDWCLLPMAAAGAVATSGMNLSRPPIPPPPIAAISALYAWRFARSVWLVEPVLTRRLLTQIPDALDLDLVAGLPEWCVYIAVPDSTAGVMLHLESDANTGRPELRILIDLGEGGLGDLLPFPVYLDRPNLTDALADMRETAIVTAGGSVGANVQGAMPDAAVAAMAENLDGYVGLAAYLSRPEADIQGDRHGVRPVRARGPVRDKTVWRVGYSG
jgi:hypothetical protein